MYICNGLVLTGILGEKVDSGYVIHIVEQGFENVVGFMYDDDKVGSLTTFMVSAYMIELGRVIFTPTNFCGKRVNIINKYGLVVNYFRTSKDALELKKNISVMKAFIEYCQECGQNTNLLYEEEIRYLENVLEND